MTAKNLIYTILATGSILLMVLVTGCGSKSPTIPIKRYEVALMELDTARVCDELYRLYEEYPLFLEGADLHDVQNQQQIYNFVTGSFSKKLLDEILAKYPNLDQFEKTLGKSFAVYTEQFGKDWEKPIVYTYLSLLDYDNRVIFMDSILVIGIDLYLGADCPHYDATELPMYIRQRLDAPFIPVDAMRAVAHYELEKKPQALHSLLDHIILNGKVAYFLEQTLPDASMADRFGYTKEQLAWCKASEYMMWSYLVGNQLLYEQDNFKYRNFISESPTVQVFPGSPGRVGCYLGYRIVKAYMDQTNQTLPELFAETDNQKILKISNYRP